jgi:formiminotetrahydrofolate cyclodeaminase
VSEIGQSISARYGELELAGLLDQTASTQPAPGGGSVAAIVVALAAALVEKSANLSEDWPDAAGVGAQARTLRERALPLAERDATAYGGVLEALRSKAGDAALAQALSEAADVPLAIAETALDVASLGCELAERGNPNLRGDAATAVLLAEAAARATANLVEINLATTEEDERIGRARALAAAAAAAAERATTAGP